MGYGTAEEALRVFRKCPKWIPGQLQGKLVRVINSIPITVMSAN
jgi:protein TonB